MNNETASEKYTYLVESFKKLPQLTFCGAPVVNFETCIRVNLNDKSEASEWVEALSAKTTCTYRVTRTYKPAMKRVSYKLDMHCHHFRKKLTQKQLACQKKKKTKTMLSDVKCKKTQCQSTLKITILEPPKGKVQKYRSTHKALIKLVFHHNHPIESAHVLGFRPVAEGTKEAYIQLFSSGHSASSAHHSYEEDILKEQGQDSIADSSTNPEVQWVHRFYREWRRNIFGAENGKSLFDQLEKELHTYNEQFGATGGKAIMQTYSAASDILTSDDSDSDEKKCTKLVKKKSSQPFILALCTPLMACVHQYVVQSAELVFCDSTSSLDRYNVSFFILSTAHPAGGLPIGVIFTSDEKEDTIKNGLEKLIQVLPSNAFYGKGPESGPSLVMTDDSSTEKRALEAVWPKSKQLLCVFHFLQRRWTWLYEGKNRISHQDRPTLLNLVKTLVYAKSELILKMKFEEFTKHPLVKKYPNFLKHVNSLWPRRHEWALCYRSQLPVRGNNTNNLSEAGVRILKEIVFSRVKAFNVVEMFQFVADKLENYYQRRILSVAHSRFDRYIQLNFEVLMQEVLLKITLKVYPMTRINF